MKIFVCLANQVGVAAKLISFGLNGRMSPRPSSSNVKWSQTPITFFFVWKQWSYNRLTERSLSLSDLSLVRSQNWSEIKNINHRCWHLSALKRAREYFFWTKLVIVEITNHLISTWGVNFKLRTIAGKGLWVLLSVYKACLYVFVAPQFVCLFVRKINFNPNTIWDKCGRYKCAKPLESYKHDPCYTFLRLS